MDSQTRTCLKTRAVKGKAQLRMNAYKKMQCKANNLNRKLKREHFFSKIESNKGSTKETWKTTNELVNKRSKKRKSRRSGMVIRSFLIQPK